MVTVLPPRGTVPAKETDPAAGATTAVPVGDPMSIPRCCPPAYGSDPSEKRTSTGPVTGQLQPSAGLGAISTAAAIAQTTMRISGHDLRCQICKQPQSSKAVGRCQIRLQRSSIEPVARDAGQARDDIGCLPARDA